MANSNLMRRLKNDLADIYNDSTDGIYVYPDDDCITTVHALIIGPKDTPYEKGFFYFVFNYPKNYPLEPPSVKLMTTGDGKVRFNPNLYSCGKVCLSILGTWSGPGWTSVMTTKSILISIQSLMNEKPFFNEPGYEKQSKKYSSSSKQYNEFLVHATLKVAVIGMVESSLQEEESKRFPMPQAMKQMVIRLFYKNVTFYENVILKNEYLNGTSSHGSFHTVTFNFNELKTKLEKVYKRIVISENIAYELYDSLKSNYCPSLAQVNNDDEKEMTDIFNSDYDTLDIAE